MCLVLPSYKLFPFLKDGHRSQGRIPGEGFAQGDGGIAERLNDSGEACLCHRFVYTFLMLPISPKLYQMHF